MPGNGEKAKESKATGAPNGSGKTGALRIEYLPLSKILRAPRNPKQHSLGELHQSMDRFGFTAPLALNEATGRLVGGHGRLDTLQQKKAAGAPPPERVEVRDGEWFVPVVRGLSFPTDADAEAYLIADNRIGELGGWQDAELAALLSDIAAQNALAGTGYDQNDVDALLTSLRLAEEAEKEGLGEDEDDVLAGPATYPVFSAEAIVTAFLAWAAASGFPYPNRPLHMLMQEVNHLASLPTEGLIRSQTGLQVANQFHPHRYALKTYKKGRDSLVERWQDPQKLGKACRAVLEAGYKLGTGVPSAFNITGQVEYLANFRPGMMLAYLREFCSPGGLVFDPCMGFGGRLVGFLASTGGQYIGTDPAPLTFAGNQRLVAALGQEARVRLYNLPIEDLDIGPFQGQCDVALTSPPYFNTEHYSDAPEDSVQRYPEVNLWREGFLRALMEQVFRALKPGGVFCLNIAAITRNGQTLPLDAWAAEDALRAGFALRRRDRLELPSTGFRRGDTVVYEPFFILTKPSS